jgi:hypothetical protein
MGSEDTGPRSPTTSEPRQPAVLRGGLLASGARAVSIMSGGHNARASSRRPAGSMLISLAPGSRVQSWISGSAADPGISRRGTGWVRGLKKARLNGKTRILSAGFCWRMGGGGGSGGWVNPDGGDLRSAL